MKLDSSYLLCLHMFFFGILLHPHTALAEGNNHSLPPEILQFDCGNVSEIPQSECDALVAVYSSTNGPGWVDGTGWLVTNSPCSWFGVACASSHVIRLDLRENQLAGPIPANISVLAELNTLDFYRNGLTGTIPAGLGNLTKLTFLALDENQLTGPIPPELGNLALLEDLWLADNQLTGAIPPELGNLLELATLDLSWNQLSGPIPVELMQLTNLDWLWLQRNQLTGTLPANLGNLTKLKYFRVNDNLLTGQLPDSMVGLALTSLAFSDTQICEPQDSAMQTWLASIENVNRSRIQCTAGQNSPQLNPAVYLPLIE